MALKKLTSRKSVRSRNTRASGKQHRDWALPERLKLCHRQCPAASKHRPIGSWHEILREPCCECINAKAAQCPFGRIFGPIASGRGMRFRSVSCVEGICTHSPAFCGLFESDRLLNLLNEKQCGGELLTVATRTQNPKPWDQECIWGLALDGVLGVWKFGDCGRCKKNS